MSAPLVAKVHLGLAIGFLMGRAGACPLVGGLISIPLMGGALSLCEIRGGCVPGVSLGNLLTDGWGCDPTWIIVWPGLLSAKGWCHIFPKWPPVETHILMNIP